MSGPTDNNTWHEAHAAEKSGDPSSLIALLLESVPLDAQEQTRAFLRRIPKRSPSDNDRRIARAVRDIENATPSGMAYSNATLLTACASAGVNPQVVASYMERRNRQGVTTALEELGHCRRRGYHRRFSP